ncbi:hypothetical protein ACWEBH_13065 [Micrococcus endophyticus]
MTTPAASTESRAVRRAERTITFLLIALATAVVVVLGLTTELTTLPRLGITLGALVVAYPVLRMLLYPRSA